MIPLTRPMKACALLGANDSHDNDSIYYAICGLKKWPKIATLKVDGIRAVRTTDLKSVRNKMIPNVSIRRRSMELPYGFDCELYNDKLQYDEIESIVMSEEHERSDEICFHTIDLYGDDGAGDNSGYASRISRAALYCEAFKGVAKYPTLVVCDTPEQLFKFFLDTEQGQGEGICFRTFDSPYKQGRSTLREEYLIKLCRYIRTEVTIIGLYEQLLNQNKSRSTSQGLTERSKAQGALLGKDTLGGFYVRDVNGLEFKVATGVGLTEQRRQFIWDRRDSYVGKQITIKHKPHGQKIKPRSPVFIGFRDTNII